MKRNEFWISFSKKSPKSSKKRKPLSSAHKQKISRTLKAKYGSSSVEDSPEVTEEKESNLDKLGKGVSRGSKAVGTGLNRADQASKIFGRTVRSSQKAMELKESLFPRKKTKLQKLGQAVKDFEKIGNTTTKVANTGLRGVESARRIASSLASQGIVEKTTRFVEDDGPKGYKKIETVTRAGVGLGRLGDKIFKAARKRRR